jgi:hypothetical protein
MYKSLHTLYCVLWLLSFGLLSGCRNSQTFFVFRAASPLTSEPLRAINKSVACSPALLAPSSATSFAALCGRRKQLIFHKAPRLMAPQVSKKTAYSPAPVAMARAIVCTKALAMPLRYKVLHKLQGSSTVMTKSVASAKGRLLQIIGLVILLGGIALSILVGGWAGFGIVLLLALLGIFMQLIGAFQNGGMP